MVKKARSRDETLTIYMGVWSQVETAKRRLQDFRELSREATVLNSVAPSFFALVQSLLIGDAVLGLCRITDAAEYNGKDHLTVRLLKRDCRGAPSLKKVDVVMAPLRDIRNNWISHADLESNVSGARATVVLGRIEGAMKAIYDWLREFGSIAGLPTDEPVDQGTWLSAPSLTAALRDARAVHSAYVQLLAECAVHDAPTDGVDQQLTLNRRSWEDSPFSESEWLRIRRRVLDAGLRAACKDLDPSSPYAAILVQVANPENDVTRNSTDRRIASRIRSEADWLLRDLQKQAGERVIGLGTAID